MKPLSSWTAAAPMPLLLPSERALEHRAVPEGAHSTLRLRLALEGVIDDYDLVLVDCPPSLGLLSINALATAGEVLIVGLGPCGATLASYLRKQKLVEQF